MSKTVRNYVKRVMLFVVMSMSVACSDWTESENVGIEYPDLEQLNPELYAAYLKALREYRVSKHRALIAKFDNKRSAPVSQAERLSGLADSVDYVVLYNPDDLSDVIRAEMAQVRRDKGIKTLYSVSYDAIEDEYAAYKDHWLADNPETGAETIKSFEVFLAERMEYYLALHDKWGYDGINFIYYGVFPLSLNEEQREILRINQEVFFQRMANWIEKNPGREVFFEGVPFNMLYDTALLEQCRYVIISALDASNMDELTFSVRSALIEGCPVDRIVILVSTPSLTDPTKDTGLFAGTYDNGERIRAIDAASEWVCLPSSDFARAGICVEQAQNDYYDASLDYKYIRKAIGTMNPSPTN